MTVNPNRYFSDPLTWFSIVAGCASIFFAVKENLWVTFTILSGLSLVLAVYVISIHGKYKRAKPYRQSRADFHSLVHRLRDACTALVDEDSEERSELIIHNSIRDILDNASRVFTEATGTRCTVSLMLPIDEGVCQTKMYSANVEGERETTQSKPISMLDGYIGKTFKYKKIQYWSGGNCGTFVPIRENYSEFYKSGLSVPIVASGVPRGVLNIDSKEENMFHAEFKDIAALFGDALALVLEMSELWYTGSGIHLAEE